MRKSAQPSAALRLAEVIAAEIHAGVVPAAAVMPTESRLAVDLMMEEADVKEAYSFLLNAGLLVTRRDDRLCVAGAPAAPSPSTERGATVLPFDPSRRGRGSSDI
jgi:DNA-binding GntR family transcriptional regulator